MLKQFLGRPSVAFGSLRHPSVSFGIYRNRVGNESCTVKTNKYSTKLLYVNINKREKSRMSKVCLIYSGDTACHDVLQD